MRGDIEIDDAPATDIPNATGARAERDAVEHDLETRLRRQADFCEARGELPWTGSLDALRMDR